MPATPAWPPKSLPRLYVRHPLGEGGTVELDGGQANYLGNVLRLKEGAKLLVFDGCSGEWLARIAETGRKRMVLTVDRRTREPEGVPDGWLAFAPGKRQGTDDGSCSRRRIEFVDRFRDPFLANRAGEHDCVGTELQSLVAGQTVDRAIRRRVEH